ncbi:unnamed protein product [Cylicostephanus goldi]|uniref:BTB domain-containing protein n=1 Tax=Cylicostephanus goldi TaxID=71465 RepID=A0A3P6QZ79_CYLGO|nr:unnamed protein product [Cylicostephanus goldi]
MVAATEVDMSELVKSGGRVKINVGGTVFETTVTTLTRLGNTVTKILSCPNPSMIEAVQVLSAMVADRWRNSADELFVDRSPTYFAKILDYLRDGENFAVPTDFDARECLRREAEFYNLPELADMCAPGLHVGDWVEWKSSAVEAYWRFFVRYEYNDRKTCPTSVDCSDCKDCGSKTCGCPLDVPPNFRYDEWMHVKHRMQFMNGRVTKADSRVCCSVHWDNGWRVHFPQSALRLATSQ